MKPLALLICIVAAIASDAQLSAPKRLKQAELNAFIRESKVIQLTRQEIAESSYPRVAGLVMKEMDDYPHRVLQHLSMQGKKWYPVEVNGTAVVLTATTVQSGSRPSVQQRHNKGHQVADQQRREQLRAQLKANADLSNEAEKKGNVTAIGELFLERKQLQGELDRRLALQSVHADRVIIRDLLVVNLGLNVLQLDTNAQPRAVFIGYGMPQAYFQTQILPDDPATPRSEFGVPDPSKRDGTCEQLPSGEEVCR